MMEAVPRVEGSLPKMEDRKYSSNRLYHMDIILYITSRFVFHLKR